DHAGLCASQVQHFGGNGFRDREAPGATCADILRCAHAELSPDKVADATCIARLPRIETRKRLGREKCSALDALRDTRLLADSDKALPFFVRSIETVDASLESVKFRNLFGGHAA